LRTSHAENEDAPRRRQAVQEERTGKIQRNHAFHSHILTKKSPGRKAALAGETQVSKANEKTVKKMLPYL